MTNNFTHNLKVIIFDKNDNIVENDELLKKIKEKLNENITHPINTPPSQIPWNIKIKWEFKELTKLQSYFMGDLFARPVYDFDSIIYEHTQLSLKQIVKELNIPEYNVSFHISRMPYDKSIIKRSYEFL